MISVIIDDLKNDRRFFMIFNDDDFNIVNESWDKIDQGLMNLQNNPLFKGFTKWNDLFPIHFKSMIAHNMAAFLDLPGEMQVNFENPISKSLNLVLMGFIKCLNDKCDSTIEMMKIKAITGHDIIIEYSATFTADVRHYISPNNFLKIVVDNDNGDNK